MRSIQKKRNGSFMVIPFYNRRVSNSLPAPGSSVYARIHGNEPGTDPYTRVISDVYQDIFQEGSFIGKGIYEIDAFEKYSTDRFPDNRILEP
jgi:cyclic beta-1,2-glucan synthetase